MSQIENPLEDLETRTQLAVFDLVVPISGPMDVPFEDWPAALTDPICKALEVKSAEIEKPLAIVYAEYKTNVDVPMEAPGYHYVHVIASEVIVADERNLAPGRVIRNLETDMKKMN